MRTYFQFYVKYKMYRIACSFSVQHCSSKLHNLVQILTHINRWDIFPCFMYVVYVYLKITQMGLFTCLIVLTQTFTFFNTILHLANLETNCECSEYFIKGILSFHLCGKVSCYFMLFEMIKFNI